MPLAAAVISANTPIAAITIRWRVSSTAAARLRISYRRGATATTSVFYANSMHEVLSRNVARVKDREQRDVVALNGDARSSKTAATTSSSRHEGSTLLHPGDRSVRRKLHAVIALAPVRAPEGPTGQAAGVATPPASVTSPGRRRPFWPQAWCVVSSAHR